MWISSHQRDWFHHQPFHCINGLPSTQNNSNDDDIELNPLLCSNRGRNPFNAAWRISVSLRSPVRAPELAHDETAGQCYNDYTWWVGIFTTMARWGWFSDTGKSDRLEKSLPPGWTFSCRDVDLARTFIVWILECMLETCFTPRTHAKDIWNPDPACVICDHSDNHINTSEIPLLGRFSLVHVAIVLVNAWGARGLGFVASDKWDEHDNMFHALPGVTKARPLGFPHIHW